MILVGDCLDVMKTLDADSIDAIVTDPPYGLGFMGKAWDHAVPGVPFWVEMLRVAKPGAYLLAFCGTRTDHRMKCAIEDAGWEIRDTIMWVYASGFPKSHNLDRERGKTFCGCEPTTEREMRAVQHADVSQAVDAGEGRGKVLLAGLSEQGASAPGWQELPSADVRTEESGMEGRGDAQAGVWELQGREVRSCAGVGEANGAGGRVHHGAPLGDGADLRIPADSIGGCGPLGPQPLEQSPLEPSAVSDQRGSQARGAWPICPRCGKPDIPRGYGTALKPAWEPITLARKPVDGTVAKNFAKHGTGGLNIAGCRVEGSPPKVTGQGWAGATGYGRGDNAEVSEFVQPAGRWPANLIHDGSEEVLAVFPQTKAGLAVRRNSGGNTFGGDRPKPVMGDLGYADSGSAARFFYCAKTSRKDRNEGCEGMAEKAGGSLNMRNDAHANAHGNVPAARENNHPTVKPTDLMRYLCRLVTPKGGTILDPFMGSGSTGKAATLEGFAFTGIDLDPEYALIAAARIEAAKAKPAPVIPPLGLFGEEQAA